MTTTSSEGELCMLSVDLLAHRVVGVLDLLDEKRASVGDGHGDLAIAGIGGTALLAVDAEFLEDEDAAFLPADRVDGIDAELGIGFRLFLASGVAHRRKFGEREWLEGGAGFAIDDRGALREEGVAEGEGAGVGSPRGAGVFGAAF